MWKLFLSLLVLLIYNAGYCQMISVPFDKNNNASATYQQLITFYEELADKYPEFTSFDSIGTTDAGKPLHLFRISTDIDNSYTEERKADKAIIMINNGIHPGEPCGIDASMLWLRDFLASANEEALSKISVLVIPIYNVGGMLNRNSHTRVNQNGPESYGFRGNANNLDLNRDFIKCNSRNAESFVKLYSDWQPHIFIDTHSTNGADYSYVMTLLATQADKANPLVAEYLNNNLKPHLYSRMKEKGYPMIPYVYSYSYGTPDKGIGGFLDLPRYSNGYATLFNALAFTTETHMLKAYEDRVLSTVDFLEIISSFAIEHAIELVELQQKADQDDREKEKWEFQWKTDTTKVDSLLFKGYTTKYKESKVGDHKRLYYDKSEPYSENIPYYRHYVSSVKVNKPSAYIIPQSRYEIIRLLRLNNIKMRELKRDTVVNCVFYKVKSYQTVNTAYEGHYMHYNTDVEKVEKQKKFHSGDFIVPTDQENIAFLMHVLEPESEDSYFNWNFFDEILQQKEHFSPYVFEDLAARFLEENPDIMKNFEKAKAASEELKNSSYKQLNWIYKRGPWSEDTYLMYPIARIE